MNEYIALYYKFKNFTVPITEFLYEEIALNKYKI
jgi:hypothetical protein